MIEREVREAVAILRMAHGKASALDLEFADALADAFEGVSSDARAVVLTGTGGIFSAGVDLVRFVGEGPEYADRFLAALCRLIDTVFSFPRPVVAGMNGHAIAGGCVLACACDLRIMSEGRGRVGVPELLVGVPFPPAAFEVLRAVTPPHLLPTTVYGGRTYLPVDALARGLVDECVPAESVLDVSLERARALAAIPPETFRLTKVQLRAPAVARIRAARRDGTAEEIARAWSRPDTLSAVRSYLQRTLGK